MRFSDVVESVILYIFSGASPRPAILPVEIHFVINGQGRKVEVGRSLMWILKHFEIQCLEACLSKVNRKLR